VTSTPARRGIAPPDNNYRLLLDPRGTVFSEVISYPEGDRTDVITAGLADGEAKFEVTLTCTGRETQVLTVQIDLTRETLRCGSTTVLTLNARQAVTFTVTMSPTRTGSYAEYALRFTP
jgi:hypothetical protein